MWGKECFFLLGHSSVIQRASPSSFVFYFNWWQGGREEEGQLWLRTSIHLWGLVSTATGPHNVDHAWSVHSATGSGVTCACRWETALQKWAWVCFSLVATAWSVYQCKHLLVSLMLESSLHMKAVLSEFTQHLELFPGSQLQLRNYLLSSCVWTHCTFFRSNCVLVM